MRPAAVDGAGQAGTTALRAGDPATAIAKIQSIVLAWVADAALLLALSMAYQASGDRKSEIAAVT